MILPIEKQVSVSIKRTFSPSAKENKTAYLFPSGAFIIFKNCPLVFVIGKEVLMLFSFNTLRSFNSSCISVLLFQL